MAYRLYKGEFRVKCGIARCPFNAEFDITQKIAGVTERDVENEAKRIARDMASIKHDAMYGRLHRLTRPAIRMVSGAIKQFGARSGKAAATVQEEDSVVRHYKKGETVVKKGEVSTTICEVIKGHVYPEHDPSFKYQKGRVFGASGLLIRQNRIANFVAGTNTTQVAFHNLRELSKTDPNKAKEVYHEAMDDIFGVIANLENHINDLDSKLQREKVKSKSYRERLKALEKELVKTKKSRKK